MVRFYQDINKKTWKEIFALTKKKRKKISKIVLGKTLSKVIPFFVWIDMNVKNRWENIGEIVSVSLIFFVTFFSFFFFLFSLFCLIQFMPLIF